MADALTAAVVKAALDVVALAEGDLPMHFAPGVVEYGPATLTVPGGVWVALVNALTSATGTPPAAAGAPVPVGPTPAAPAAEVAVPI